MKNRTVVILTLLIISYPCFAQTTQKAEGDYISSGLRLVSFVSTVEKARELAHKDIEEGNLFLQLQGGISPQVYDSDRIFEARYKVFYFDYGCIGPKDETAAAYSEVIFEHLDSLYGKKWRRQVRKDVLYFKKWKRKQITIK